MLIFKLQIFFATPHDLNADSDDDDINPQTIATDMLLDATKDIWALREGVNQTPPEMITEIVEDFLVRCDRFNIISFYPEQRPYLGKAHPVSKIPF